MISKNWPKTLAVVKDYSILKNMYPNILHH